MPQSGRPARRAVSRPVCADEKNPALSVDRKLFGTSTIGSHPARSAPAVAPHGPPRSADACRSAIGRPILQKGVQPQELSAAIERPIHCPGEDIDSANGAFMDTAAIMKNLDLIISSDTSTPHLAGALGVPVWIALPFVASWQWMRNRTDSPWYPTARLFRQTSPGDWTGVFAQIRGALRVATSSAQC